MTKHKSGTIYALIDPRDDSVRYIGKTTQDLLARLAGHLATPTNPAMRVWINALGVRGLVPHIQSVTSTSLDRLDDEEKRQILRHAKAGHRLLNAPYYQRNLGDLFAPVVAVVAPPEPEERAAKGDAIAHKMFGPIATARAAGRMPKWKAAAHVLLRAPVVSAAHLWLMAAGVRAFRRLLVLGLSGFYLWTVGFGRVFKDLVFPHLPITELRRFWDGYLAAPVQTLSWHALAVFVAAGIVSYLQVAEAALASQPKAKAKNSRRETPSSLSPLVADLARDPVTAAAAAALDQATRPRRP